MRFAEFVLMSLPGLLIIGWFLGARPGSFRALAALACGLAAFGFVLFWMGDHRSFSGVYHPAHLDRGRVIPGQGS